MKTEGFQTDEVLHSFENISERGRFEIVWHEMFMVKYDPSVLNDNLPLYS